MSDMPLVIRDEYLHLLDGDACAAAILNAFEMWSANRADYIYKSVKDMQADLKGVFGRNRISEAFKLLRDRGFLLARHNPVMAADRTLQYLFQPVAILGATFSRLLKALKPHILSVMLHALLVKHHLPPAVNESESIPEYISEGKSELDSRIISDERDFQPEGIDPRKFLQDDPSPNPDGVPPYLREQIPSAEIRQQLTAHAQRLGLKLYAEVMSRCTNARSWEYVLKALATEQAPAPIAPPPSPVYDTTEFDHSSAEFDEPAVPKPLTPEQEQAKAEWGQMLFALKGGKS